MMHPIIYNDDDDDDNDGGDDDDDDAAADDDDDDDDDDAGIDQYGHWSLLLFEIARVRQTESQQQRSLGKMTPVTPRGS